MSTPYTLALNPISVNGEALYGIVVTDENGERVHEDKTDLRTAYRRAQAVNRICSITKQKPDELDRFILGKIADDDAAVADSANNRQAKPFDLEFVSSRALAELDCRPEWAIKRVVVRNQPMIVGAGKKQLKTCILTDAAISAATKTDFLGKFEVPHSLRVGFLSGESGKPTIKAVAQAICLQRGFTLDCVDGLHFGFRLPSLINNEHLAITERTIKEHGLQILIYDPLYRGIGGTTNTANLVEVGEVLDRIATLCLDCNCTPILVHHAIKHLPVGEMPELEMFSGAGYAEFARQWFLANRQEPYQSDGIHKLLCSVGGSVGFSHQFALKIDEGQLDENFSGRKWIVSVTSTTVAWAEQHERRVEQKQQAREEDDEAKVAADRRRVLAVLNSSPDGVSISMLRGKAKMGKDRCDYIAELLVSEAQAEWTEVNVSCGSGRTRKVPGVRKKSA